LIGGKGVPIGIQDQDAGRFVSREKGLRGSLRRSGLRAVKIAGLVHLALGQAYEEADNGNRSEIHWDMVKILTAEHGGGELALDGTVIQRDGMFIVSDLQDLNPERLLRNAME
jgi:hypothetical protein